MGEERGRERKRRLKCQKSVEEEEKEGVEKAVWFVRYMRRERVKMEIDWNGERVVGCGVEVGE